MNWGTQMDAFEDIFANTAKARLYSYINNANTKYVYLGQYSTASLVCIFHPSNGSLIEARQFAYPFTYSSSTLKANGRISDDKIVHSIRISSSTRAFVTFINIDTWESSSYYVDRSVYLEGFSPLFNTDQIFLILDDSTTSSDYTMVAPYDKLHYTEVFEQTSITFEVITSNFTVNSLTVVQTLSSNTPSDLTITPTTPTFETDTARSYKVTANIHSTSTATYNATVNTTTTLGPIGFDCYTMNVNATNANFTNSISFSHSEGLDIPGWVYFNPSDSEVLVFNNTEVSSNVYTITNSLTGVFDNITYATNFTINIVEDSTTNDDEYCLNESSKALCGLYIGLIAFASIVVLVFIIVALYCTLD